MADTAAQLSITEEVLTALFTDADARKQYELRCRQARIIREVSTGNYEHLVIALLRNKFNPKIFDKLLLDHGVKRTNNLLRDMVRKTCLGFARGCDFSLDDPEGEPSESPEFDSLIAAFKMNGVLASTEKRCKQYGSIYAMPTVAYSHRLGERLPAMELHTPETYDLIWDPENPRDYIAVAIFDEVIKPSGFWKSAKTVRRATLWTREFWFTFLEDGKEWRRVAKQDNPFKTIPGTRLFDAEPMGERWPDGDGWSWAEDTIRISGWETYKEYLAAAQVKTLIGQFDETFPSGQILRHGGAISMGTSDQAKAVAMLDFQTDLQGWDTVMIQKPRDRSAVSAGLPVDEFNNTVVPQSGKALQLRYVERDQDVVSRQNVLADQFPELYAMTWWVTYVEMARSGGAPIRGISALPPGAPPFKGFDPVQDGRLYRPKCNPIEGPVIELEVEWQSRIAFSAEKGFASRADEMRKIDPNLTRGEARAQVIRNLADEATFSNAGAVKLEARKLDIAAGIVTAPPSKADIPPGTRQPIPVADNMNGPT